MRLRGRHRRYARTALVALIAFACAAIQASAALASFPSSPELDNFAADLSPAPQWITPALGEGAMSLDVAATPHQFTGTNGQFDAAIWNATYGRSVQVWATIARGGTGDASLYADVAGGSSASARVSRGYFADFGGTASGGSRSEVSIWRIDSTRAETRLTLTGSPYVQLAPGDQIGLSNNRGAIVAWYRPAGGAWRAVLSTTDSRYTLGRIGLEALPGADYGFSAFGGGTPSAPVKSRRTTITVSSPLATVSVGRRVRYTATVSPAPSRSGGRVAFLDGYTVIPGCEARPVKAGGRATCTVTYHAAGKHAVNALYTGSPSATLVGSAGTRAAVVRVTRS
jgi:Bacterial Ig-like domain (group 3)